MTKKGAAFGPPSSLKGQAPCLLVTKLFLGLRMGRQGRYEIVYEAAANGQSLICAIKSESVMPDTLST